MVSRIKNIKIAVFEIPIEEINEESSPNSISKLNSLNLKNLVVFLV